MTMQNNAIEIAKVLSEKKARDITVINIAEKSSFADFFINATAGSDRQLSALLDFRRKGSRARTRTEKRRRDSRVWMDPRRLWGYNYKSIYGRD